MQRYHSALLQKVQTTVPTTSVTYLLPILSLATSVKIPHDNSHVIVSPPFNIKYCLLHVLHYLILSPPPPPLHLQ